MSDYISTNSANAVIRRSDQKLILSFSDESDWNAYQMWAAQGNTPDPPAPRLVISARQARLALLAAGLLDQVNNAVAATGGATKISWDYATVLYRDDPLVSNLAAGLNLTSEQVDTLFASAATF